MFYLQPSANQAKLGTFVFAFAFPRSLCSSACLQKCTNNFWNPSASPLAVTCRPSAGRHQVEKHEEKMQWVLTWLLGCWVCQQQAMLDLICSLLGPRGCREPRLSPPVAISLPGVGVLQNEGCFCCCRKILSPSQNTSYSYLLPFAQGDWFSGRERKE